MHLTRCDTVTTVFHGAQALTARLAHKCRRYEMLERSRSADTVHSLVIIAQFSAATATATATSAVSAQLQLLVLV
jgi:hypothetical protein